MKPCETNTWLFRRRLCRLFESHHRFHAAYRRAEDIFEQWRSPPGNWYFRHSLEKQIFADKNYIKAGIDDPWYQARLGIRGTVSRSFLTNWFRLKRLSPSLPIPPRTSLKFDISPILFESPHLSQVGSFLERRFLPMPLAWRAPFLGFGRSRLVAPHSLLTPPPPALRQGASNDAFHSL